MYKHRLWTPVPWVLIVGDKGVVPVKGEYILSLVCLFTGV